MHGQEDLYLPITFAEFWAASVQPNLTLINYITFQQAKERKRKTAKKFPDPITSRASISSNYISRKLLRYDLNLPSDL
jgi:hypothetical protein